MNGCNVATPGFLGDFLGKTFEESGRSSTEGPSAAAMRRKKNFHLDIPPTHQGATL